jgi:hypothetical protein
VRPRLSPAARRSEGMTAYRDKGKKMTVEGGSQPAADLVLIHTQDE